MIKNKTKRTILLFIIALLPIGALFLSTNANSQQYVVGAACCAGNCAVHHCPTVAKIIIQYHALGESVMNLHIAEEFRFHGQDTNAWMLRVFFKEHILRAMMMMTEQLSAIAYQQAFIGGIFMDAKNQLETQRLTQELEYEAHRDYQPSEDFCYFGTNIRSLHGSNAVTQYTKDALTEQSMKRHLGNKNLSSAGSIFEEKTERWNNFTTLYCDPSDNSMNVVDKDGTGLKAACKTPPSDKQRVNADIDFTRIIDSPRTINADFTKPDIKKEGEDTLALLSNLYGYQSITRQTPFMSTTGMQEKYMGLRSVTAKRNVAQNSMNNIIAMKTAGTEEESAKTARFMGKLLENLGVPSNETEFMLGKNPSYYAQLETLSKRIAQSPEFYSNLYDKPANVTRKGVAIQALNLILEREIYKSQIRREMLISVLLSSKLKRDTDITNRGLSQ